MEASGEITPLRRAGRRPRRLALAIVLLAVPFVAQAQSVAMASSSSLAACAFGTDIPGLKGFLGPAVQQAADSYAAGLQGDDASTRARARQIFAAAATAYAYGLAQVSVRATVKHLPRNEIVSVNALADPTVQTVVSPNVDTAYTVEWLDLTTGPVVINVPDTEGRFYTFQFLDAFSNAFAYVGSGSTGTRAGAYALVGPGWSGSIPAGVTRIDSPSSTVWLLGRTLVNSTADLPAVKKLQEQYESTPLAAWETGTRQAPVVLSQYPPTIPKSIPTGAEFIATLNDEMNIDPPPAADECALEAMGPAGVQVPHPTPAQSLLDDLSDEAPPLPSIAGNPFAGAALSAGTAAGARIIVTAEAQLSAASRSSNNGWEILGNWVGRYGTRYLGRAIVARDLLGANTPQQSIYPIADDDVTGRRLDGGQRYTIRFPKGELPPVDAFWSLTLYDASDFLYANPLDRYAIGDRTQGLHHARDGSLTLYVQHAAPSDLQQRANWLPAPSGSFHLVLRLYQPKPVALDGRWKPAPIERLGAVMTPRAPRLTALRIHPAAFRPAARGAMHGRRGPARVSYRLSRPVLTEFEILAVHDRRGCRKRPQRVCTRDMVVGRFTEADRAGRNHFFLTGRARGHRLGRGRYLLRAAPGGLRGTPRGAVRRVTFRIL
jgi:hypothetical protein